MRIILFFLLFLPFVISAQTNELNGRIVVLSSSGTDPNFTVSASFSSTMGFSASQVIVGDIIVARYVSGATHSRNLYKVTSVSASGSNLTLGVTRLSGVSTPFFPTGTHAIVRKTNSGLIYDAANVSQEIESYTTNYNLGLLEGFKIDTVTISSDTLVVALENGDNFVVAIPGIGGSNFASNGLSLDGDTIQFGGVLNQNTNIDLHGKTLVFDGENLGGSELQVNNGAYLSLENLKLKRTNNSTGTVFANVTINPVTLTLPAGVNNQVRVINNACGSSFVIDPNGSETIAGAATLTLQDGEALALIYNSAATDWIVWARNASGVGGGGVVGADTCYAVSISGGNTGSHLWVCANGTGVTASWSSNVLTIASTTNVKVKSADWRLVAADISSSADAGGVSNWVQVKFTNTRGNTGLTDLRIPAVQKVAIPGSGALSVTNAASIDIDNNPANSVVGVASNSVTIRAGGLVAAGQGYYLKFTGIH